MAVNRRISSASGLELLEVAGDSKKGPVVIMLHGYGANGNDLLPLHQSIDPSQKASWYFPHGFVKIPFGPGIYGRAWFPINIAALEESMQTGQYKDISSVVPEGIDEAREKLSALIAEIVKEREISYQDIIIGGFSQGAMLATDVCLESQEKFAQLIILSGSLLHKEKWTKRIPLKAGMKFFQSHGRHDPILAFPLAEELYSLLCAGEWEGELVSFSGGHEIPEQVISSVKEILHS